MLKGTCLRHAPRTVHLYLVLRCEQDVGVCCLWSGVEMVCPCTDQHVLLWAEDQLRA